jgi:hypothetical protein
VQNRREYSAQDNNIGRERRLPIEQTTEKLQVVLLLLIVDEQYE